MNIKIIMEAVSGALGNIAVAAVGLLAAYAIHYITLASARVKEQTKQIKNDAARQCLENAINDVINLATVSVGAMEQTTARALREAIRIGAADREELLALGDEVFMEIKAAIAPEAQRVITDNLGSFDRFLRSVIEDAVLKVKMSDTDFIVSERLATAGTGSGDSAQGE